jgi:hypothetical protein
MEPYLALEYAQPTLVDIHDGVIDSFPIIDYFVIMHAGHNEDG